MAPGGGITNEFTFLFFLYIYLLNIYKGKMGCKAESCSSMISICLKTYKEARHLKKNTSVCPQQKGHDIYFQLKK